MKAMDWNRLNDRKLREKTLRDLIGDARYEEDRVELETADAAQEAASFILQMRLHKGWTQAELAERLGVSQARVSEIERGGSPEGVSYSLLRRVARACDLEGWPPPPIAAAKAGDEVAVMVVADDDADTIHERRPWYMRKKRLRASAASALGTEGGVPWQFHPIETFEVVIQPRTGKPLPVSSGDKARIVREALQNSPLLKLMEK